MQSSMDATRGRTAQVNSHTIINFVLIMLQRDQSQRSNGSQGSTSRRSHRDDPPHDQSHSPSPPRPPRLRSPSPPRHPRHHSPSPPRPPRHRSPSPPRPPRHRGRSRLGHMQDGPRGRSHQRNSSHATTNDDEPRQRPLSRDVNRHRRDLPTSAPQEAHTSAPEGRRPHRRSSPDDNDDRSPRVRMSSKRKGPSTPPTSGMKSKKARTVVTSD